ncbi:MAG: carboxypeptidase-like regulatory domain-containing protein, partial [Bacteroidetes bacterium]|nr:carboxypeptidase-like regulatory domain-containing protein [Bacteroidota bacterium]
MRINILAVTAFLSLSVFAQKFTLSGRVKDAANGETLIGASILVKGGGGAVTNEYGFYSITLEAGLYEITYKYLGYGNIVEKVNLNKDITRNIELGVTSNEIGVAVVSAKALEKRVENKQISVVKM